MNKTFTYEELISFGNYLLSKEREANLFRHNDQLLEMIDERRREVSHADLENWVTASEPVS